MKTLIVACLVWALAAVSAAEVVRERPQLNRPALSEWEMSESRAQLEQLREGLSSGSSSGVQLEMQGATKGAAVLPGSGDAAPGVAEADGLPPGRPLPFSRTDEQLAGSRAIFGSDDRGLPEYDFPYFLVGKLISDDTTCSAALVGPRHILTAAHCFERFPDGSLNRAVFVPYYDRGIAPKGKASVVFTYYGAVPARAGRSEDYAICVLDRRLGDELGWFGTRGIADQWFHHPSTRSEDNAEFVMAGYSGDWYSGERMGVDWRTWLYLRYDNDRAVVAHDGDTTAGASGGPVFGRFSDQGWYVVCVNIGEPRGGGRFSAREPHRGVANVCVDVARFSGALEEALREHP